MCRSDLEGSLLPPRLYRVDYGESSTIYDAQGLRAGAFRDEDSNNTFDPPPKDALERHLTWDPSPSPYISLFSDEKHAENWMLKRAKRSGGENCRIIEVDVEKLNKKHIFYAYELVHEHSLDVPPEIMPSIRGEYLVLGHIPSSAIIGSRTASEVAKARSITLARFIPHTAEDVASDEVINQLRELGFVVASFKPNSPRQKLRFLTSKTDPIMERNRTSKIEFVDNETTYGYSGYSEIQNGSSDSELECGFSKTKKGNEERDELAADIKSRLAKSLDNLPAMNFASSGSCPSEVNPAISLMVPGSSSSRLDIGLPLSERDAKLISSLKNDTFYGNGKGNNIIEGLSVRNSRVLKAGQFTLRNPRWDEAIQKLAEKVGTELGVPRAARIEAVPHKLILHGDGSRFNKYSDAEADGKMFGTLVICLPSQHKGGDVHITHGGKTKILRTAESSEFGYTYLCWYAGIGHAVAEVTAGYRLVLTYTLINSNPEKRVELPAGFSIRNKELEDILLFWKGFYSSGESNTPTTLAYILEHLYSERTLTFLGLQGGDRIRGECLADLCQRHGFRLYLAIPNGRVMDREAGSEHNAWPKLQHVVEIDGAKLLHLLPFGCEPDEKGFTCPTRTHKVFKNGEYHEVPAAEMYHQSVALLIPEEYRIDFHFQTRKASARRMIDWLDQLLGLCTPASSDSPIRSHLKKACWLITRGAKDWREKASINYMGSTPFTEHVLVKVLRGGICLKDRELCVETLSLVPESFLCPITIEIIETFGFTEIKEGLETSVLQFEHASLGLKSLIGIYDEYKRRNEDDSQTITVLLEWMKDHATRICREMMLFSTKCGAVIVKVGARCGETYFIECFVRTLIDRIQIEEGPESIRYGALNRVVLGFLTETFNRWKDDEFTYEGTRNVFDTVLEVFIPKLVLTDPRIRRSRQDSFRIGASELPESILEPKHAILLIHQCVSLDLVRRIVHLLAMIEMLASTDQPAISFKGFLLPFSKELVSISADSCPYVLPQTIREEAYRLGGLILNLFASRCIGPEPARPADWTRSKCSCTCDHGKVDAFLEDPEQAETRIFTTSEKCANHLKEHLPRIKHYKPWIEWEAEHDVEIIKTSAGFDVSIRKTERAWINAVELWEKDRDAAVNEISLMFTEEQANSFQKRCF
ncbi:hypothetical protein FQN57_002715 [Myotisia sp. PD_48]|nr:hypothetical protein FQN57_002715 [Myotisia sp. PD_48]